VSLATCLASSAFDFKKFRNLIFQSCVFNVQVGNLLFIELLFGGSHFSSSSGLTRLLSGGRGTQLEKKRVFFLPIPPEYAIMWKNSEKVGIIEERVCYLTPTHRGQNTREWFLL
jgi:hypothetical protein